LLAHVHREEIAPVVEPARASVENDLGGASEDFVSAAQLLRVAEIQMVRGDQKAPRSWSDRRVPWLDAASMLWTDTWFIRA
jgi:hypothetical protein